jgi:hypothetical protein
MGPETNVETIDFENDGLAPSLVSGRVQDRMTDKVIPVETFLSTRIPLSRKPSWLANKMNLGVRQLRLSGVNSIQAFARAQGMSDSSMDQVVTATGELDALRYGGLLNPRGLVGLRGVGDTYGGVYYVRSVTHTIRKEQYKQLFTITREGVGALLPVVIP